MGYRSLLHKPVLRFLINSIKCKLISSIVVTSSQFAFFRAFRTSSFVLSEQKFLRHDNKIVKKDGTVIRKKTEPLQKIMLLDEGKTVVMTWDEGSKLARRRNLELYKVQDPTSKTPMPLYKLVSEYATINEKQLGNTKTKKKDKVIMFSPRIAENDLERKVNNMIKHLHHDGRIMFCIELSQDKSDNVACKVINLLKNCDLKVNIKEISFKSRLKSYQVSLANDKSNKNVGAFEKKDSISEDKCNNNNNNNNSDKEAHGSSSMSN